MGGGGGGGEGGILLTKFLGSHNSCSEDSRAPNLASFPKIYWEIWL